MKIKEIEEQLKKSPIEEIPLALEAFLEDERQGVKKILEKYHKKYQNYQSACDAWHARLAFDEIMGEGQPVIGIDEVGRGPLAGPVVAAAVILPKEANLIGLRDSKKLSESKREALYEEIKQVALGIGIGIVDAPEIDEINILQATFKAMRQALSQVESSHCTILVDGDKIIPHSHPNQQAIISGDDKSAAIGAASVIAKVTRDRMMAAYDEIYQGYDWQHNKGYGSEKHYQAIRALGITPLHRKSFLKNEGIV